MENQDEIVITLSRKKTFLMAIGSLGFVIAGVWVLMLGAIGVGIVCILFFGFCLICAINKLFETSAGLVLNDQGFYNNSCGLPEVFVPWAEVVGIVEFEVSGIKTISIFVNDPDKYVGRGNLVQRLLNRDQLKSTDTPISISAHILNIDHDQLFSTFESYVKNYCDLELEQ
ncbi:MAG: hypothetical protein FVQ82_10650 [Planctomycetes bacterium]|nr:hypothetical protein [Planctomycetota bacterium]